MRPLGQAMLMAVMLVFSSTALAQSFEMDVQETDDLRLLYFDPTTNIPDAVCRKIFP